jgi:hypothetical protein
VILEGDVSADIFVDLLTLKPFQVFSCKGAGYLKLINGSDKPATVLMIQATYSGGC